jgi:hypothetical protein
MNGNLLIGWGRTDYSTTEQVVIPGQMYMRVSEGIMDPLYATALCIDGGAGEDLFIFCSCDLGNFPSHIVEEVLDKVAELKPEIPRDRIILNCTHTHTVPAIYATPEYSEDGRKLYPGTESRKFTVQKIAEAIREAYENRKPGGYAFGYGYAVVAQSRRSTYSEDMSVYDKNPVSPNGHAIMYGRTNRPEFIGYEAGADHFLNALYTVDETGKLTGIVVNVPCPSQTSETFSVLSADYWGDVRKQAAEAFGPDVYILPQCAAAGDLSPRILHYCDAQKRRFKLKYDLDVEITVGARDHNKAIGERYDIAERIIAGLKEIYGWAKKDLRYSAPVRVRKLDLELSARLVTEEECRWCEKNLEKMKNDLPSPENVTPEEYMKIKTQYDSIYNRNKWIPEKYKAQHEGDTRPSKVFTVALGEIAFATNRYELYMDYMHRIQARSPFLQTFVVQLSGDDYGHYLATERGVKNRGYSASLFDNQVSPEGGQQLVEATLTSLNELYEETNRG